jgi:catechol 2,3-dioxygenase-like lactoylglutathione lyase family enzyme
LPGEDVSLETNTNEKQNSILTRRHYPDRFWAKAIEFYETILGFPVTHRGPTLMGFETGAFCLYVEKGNRPGSLFDFLVPDMLPTKSRLVAAGRAVVEKNPTVPRCYIQDPFGLVFNIEQRRK